VEVSLAVSVVGEDYESRKKKKRIRPVGRLQNESCWSKGVKFGLKWGMRKDEQKWKN